MVSHDEIEALLNQNKSVHYAHVLGDGYHYELTIVSEEFEHMSAVKRQQWVYAKLSHWITSGELHALTMTTLTPDEWEENRE